VARNLTARSYKSKAACLEYLVLPVRTCAAARLGMAASYFFPLEPGDDVISSGVEVYGAKEHPDEEDYPPSVGYFQKPGLIEK